MEKMVNIFLFGKKYEVPENLTIMTAMEYAGYQLVRGCGCRNGFCGACATIYRIKGDKELKACLACQTKVEDNMYIATLPFFPLVKEGYDIENIPVNESVMMQLYPEISVSCAVLRANCPAFCRLYLLQPVTVLCQCLFYIPMCRKRWDCDLDTVVAGTHYYASCTSVHDNLYLSQLRVSVSVFLKHRLLYRHERL